MKSSKQYVLFILFGILIAAGLYSFNSVRAKIRKQEAKQQAPASVPKVLSCVKGIQIVRSEIENAGRPDASLAVEVKNITETGIVAIAMESTNGKEAYTVTLRSSFQGNPRAVIESRETGTLRMEVGNIFPNALLRIGGVIYSDGTEEGCGSSLQTLHELKKEDEKKKESSQ